MINLKINIPYLKASKTKIFTKQDNATAIEAIIINLIIHSKHELDTLEESFKKDLNLNKDLYELLIKKKAIELLKESSGLFTTEKSLDIEDSIIELRSKLNRDLIKEYDINNFIKFDTTRLRREYVNYFKLLRSDNEELEDYNPGNRLVTKFHEDILEEEYKSITNILEAWFEDSRYKPDEKNTILFRDLATEHSAVMIEEQIEFKLDGNSLLPSNMNSLSILKAIDENNLSSHKYYNISEIISQKYNGCEIGEEVNSGDILFNNFHEYIMDLGNATSKFGLDENIFLIDNKYFRMDHSKVSVDISNKVQNICIPTISEIDINEASINHRLIEEKLDANFIELNKRVLLSMINENEYSNIAWISEYISIYGIENNMVALLDQVLDWEKISKSKNANDLLKLIFKLNKMDTLAYKGISKTKTLDSIFEISGYTIEQALDSKLFENWTARKNIDKALEFIKGNKISDLDDVEKTISEFDVQTKEISSFNYGPINDYKKKLLNKAESNKDLLRRSMRDKATSLRVRLEKIFKTDKLGKTINSIPSLKVFYTKYNNTTNNVLHSGSDKWDTDKMSKVIDVLDELDEYLNKNNKEIIKEYKEIKKGKGK